MISNLLLTGSNQHNKGQPECDLCPAGYYCPIKTSILEKCPPRHYCPAGTTVPLTCPNGTFTHDNMTGLANASQCLPCITGFYCRIGQVVAPCDGGYYCKAGSPDPNPSGYRFPIEAAPCAEGYYCPNGTLLPIPCPANTMKNYTGGYGRLSDCTPCLAGRYCLNGKIDNDNDDYDDDDFIHFFIDVTYNILNAIEVQFGIHPAEENGRYITFKKCRRLS